ncbi:hypothetical protein TRFO_20346 [Tritrichomonas foetus]|uniref:non-specific serine/threonine protein kinase n=1 Tax=Tritrichomonas foetus TaxID=1144522 RepID=A0A1J4KKR1_9EUKA|nr:hypothetical protein TRFO_20346 [Tritrichomonas foetus]|eukprot:OHT10388.1 hypothetical protein TRFO_20346 [Tritrichomonas foetus]
MLDSICLSNDLYQIKSDYKNFKHAIYDALADANDLSLPIEESKLIESIENLFQMGNGNQNKEIEDETILRIIIGAYTLSKYSLIYQDKSMHFFQNIPRPKSLVVYRFLCKIIAKKSKNYTSPWDSFVDETFNSILPMKEKEINPIEENDIEYALIYIEALIKYSSDFAEKHFERIFIHLINIIEKSKNKLLNFSCKVLKKLCFEYPSASIPRNVINSIPNWNEESYYNALCIFSTIFEVNPTLVNDYILTFLTKFLSGNNEKEFYLSLYALNFCSDQISNFSQLLEPFDIYSKIFDSSSITREKLIIITKLVNDSPSDSLDEQDIQNIWNIIESSLFANDKDISCNGFHFLDTCIKVGIEFPKMNEIIEKIRNFPLQNNCNSLYQFLIDNDENKYIQMLISSLNITPYKTLKYLSFNWEILENKTEKSIELLVDSIFNLINNNDEKIRVMIPFVASTLSPNWTNKCSSLLIQILLCDPSNSVRSSFLKNIKKPFSNRFLETDFLDILELLLNDSSQLIRIETVKLICRMSHLNPFGLFSILHPYFIFDEQFLSPRKLAERAEFYSYAFKSFPDCLKMYNNLFYDSAMKFLNNIPKFSTLLAHTFYEKTFCYYISTLDTILKNNFEFLQSRKDETVNFCLEKLSSGLTKNETYEILLLLENIILTIGVEQSQNYKTLFTIIFNTGSLFISPKIHQHILKILGFIGAQQPIEPPHPMYNCEKDDSHKNNTWKASNPKHQALYYYKVCSAELFNILEDDSLSRIHFYAFEALGKMMSAGKFCYSDIADDFNRFMKYFQSKISTMQINQGKDRIIGLLEHLVKLPLKIIKDSIPILVQTLIDLWNYGSLRIVKTFAISLAAYFTPYLNKIIPLIRSSDDTENVINSLICIALCSAIDTHFNDEIIDILVQMVNSGKYEALNGLRIIIIRCYIHKHIGKICLCCLKCIYHEKSHNIALQVIYNLILNYDINNFIPIIKSSLKNYPNDLRDLNSILKKGLQDNKSPIVDDRVPPMTIGAILSPKMKTKEFFSYFDMKNIESRNFEQWMKNLMLFCVKYSPSQIISSTIYVAQNNQIFSRNIFSIAFHSCYIAKVQELKKCKLTKSPLLKGLEIGIQMIPKAFLYLLCRKDITPKCYAEITDLIEFMDRAGHPLFDTENGSCQLTPCILSNKPPLSLRFALTHFDKCLNTPKQKEAANELARAFLRIGMYEQFDHFTNKFESSHSPFSDIFPVHTYSIYDKAIIKNSNDFFMKKDWGSFNKEIEKCNNKVVTHLFKAASLIAQNKNPDNVIEKGFKLLGQECGAKFAQGFTSVFPAIIHAQQFYELKELKNLDNFNIRTRNSNGILYFLPPVLLLRIAAKNEYHANSFDNFLEEKVKLLNLYRKANDWDMMNKFFNKFFDKEKTIPIEAEIEMLHYKVANNLTSEEEFDIIIRKTQDNEKLQKYMKYQKAKFLARANEFEVDVYEKVIDLCENNDNIKAIRLWSWANMKIFKILPLNKTALINSVHGFVQSAILNESMRIADMSIIISLIFSHGLLSINDFQVYLEKLPLHFYIDSINQILSNPLINITGNFKGFIMKILTDLAANYPSAVIYPYMFSILCDNRYIKGKPKDTPIKEIAKIYPCIFSEAKRLYSSLIAAASTLSSYCIEISTKIEEYINGELKDEKSFNDRKWFLQDLIINMKRHFKSTNINEHDKKFIEEYHQEYKFVTETLSEMQVKLRTLNELCPRNHSNRKLMKPMSQAIDSVFVKRSISQSPALQTSEEVNQQNQNSISNKLMDNQPTNNQLTGNQLETNLQYTHSNSINIESKESANDKDQIQKCKEYFANVGERMKNIRRILRDGELKSPKIIDLFVASPELEKMTDLPLPVFGTFHYNQPTIYINKFIQKVNVIVSKQRPRKITIVGSDGHKYPFILKGHEDLRLDQRVMQFLNLLNGVLRTHIMTYSITPLTTAVGLIQFVNDMTTIRDMIMNYRKSLQKPLPEIEIENFLVKSEVFCQQKEKLKFYGYRINIQRYETFREIMSQTDDRKNDLRESLWFSAPDSETWMKYKINFTSTAAVTSIAGYIIGLGDRHTSNLMLSNRNGSLMHIDYGDSFEVTQQRIDFTEKIPFRLTRMMIAAFGPCGATGSFQHGCEETLSIIREHQEEILDALEVFSRSPLQQGGMCYGLRRSQSEMDSQKPALNSIMKRITEKVTGNDFENEKPLSVHEQVNKLIQQASNEYNWATSYLGWGPWW